MSESLPSFTTIEPLEDKQSLHDEIARHIKEFKKKKGKIKKVKWGASANVSPTAFKRLPK